MVSHLQQLKETFWKRDYRDNSKASAGCACESTFFLFVPILLPTLSLLLQLWKTGQINKHALKPFGLSENRGLLKIFATSFLCSSCKNWCQSFSFYSTKCWPKEQVIASSNARSVARPSNISTIWRNTCESTVVSSRGAGACFCILCH